MEIQYDGACSTLGSDWYTAKTPDREVIQKTKLEDVLRKVDIKEEQPWKLDVEGAEYEALVGRRRLSSKPTHKVHPSCVVTQVSLAISLKWRHVVINL
jgi:hypothetical protein